MEEKLIPGGYILLSKKIIDSEIFKKPPLYIKVWVYLLSKAQFQKYKQLERGQLFISIPDIQEACSWQEGYRKHTPTKDQIFNILKWLREPYGSNDGSNDDTTMITTTKATHGMLINIVNFNKYQNSKNYGSNDGSNDGNATGTLREQRQDDNIKKEEEEYKLKDTRPKKESKAKTIFTEDDKEYKLARYLSRCIAKRLDKPLKDEKTLQNWANDFNKIIRIDKYEPDEILEVLQFSQNDEFWRKQILSASNFRDKYEKLLSQLKG